MPKWVVILFYCFVVLCVIFYAFMIANNWHTTPTNNPRYADYPIGGDFPLYYVASNWVWCGRAEDIYNYLLLHKAESEIAGLAIKFNLPFHYPPHYIFLIAPLTALPYIPSLIFWLTSTFIAYGSVIYGLARHWIVWPLLLIFPGTFMNVLHGQDGFLTSTFMGGGPGKSLNELAE